MKKIEQIKAEDVIDNMEGKIQFKRGLQASGDEKSFRESIEDIKNTVYNTNTPYENFDRDVAITSGNIHNFLPKVDDSKYDSFVRDIYYNESMVMLEMGSYYSLCQTEFDDFEEIEKLTKPIILTTFHHGPYRTLCGYLLSKGIDVVLLMDENDIDTLHEFFEFFVQIINKKFEVMSSLKLVSASSPGSLVELSNLVKNTKNNTVILTYIDANYGSSGKEVSPKLSHSMYRVNDFLGKHNIRVRKGIPKLSKMLDLSIYHVVSERQENNIVSHKISDKFNPKENTNNEPYEEVVLKKLYKRLEGLIKKAPSMWAGWHYIHKMMEKDKLFVIDNEPIISNKKYTFNKKYFTVYSVKNKYYLFDRRTYLSYLIDETLFLLFKSTKKFYLKDIHDKVLSIDSVLQKNVIN